MNDKKQLAAMGEHLAEQQPMCMEKRIEELEEQVRVMAELLREAKGFVVHVFDSDINYWSDNPLLLNIDAALSGKLPAPVVPEGWQRVPAQAADAHPMQPILLDPTGRPRFKKNSAVEYLAEGRLNEIASRGYSDEDMAQLAQLIGYSVDGFSELSYVSDADYARAVAATTKPEVK